MHGGRLASLTGKLAVIALGGRSEVEVGESRDRFVDTLNAARSALEGGVLPGGGAALFHGARLARSVQVENADERRGAEIFAEVLEQPMRRIISNSIGGGAAVGRIVERVRANEDFWAGFDVRNEEVVDMYEAGVVDSLKVVKSVVSDALGLATLVVMTECAVVKAKSYTPLPLEHYQERRELF